MLEGERGPLPLVGEACVGRRAEPAGGESRAPSEKTKGSRIARSIARPGGEGEGVAKFIVRGVIVKRLCGGRGSPQGGLRGVDDVRKVLIDEQRVM